MAKIINSYIAVSAIGKGGESEIAQEIGGHYYPAGLLAFLRDCGGVVITESELPSVAAEACISFKQRRITHNMKDAAVDFIPLQAFGHKYTSNGILTLVCNYLRTNNPTHRSYDNQK